MDLKLQNRGKALSASSIFDNAKWLAVLCKYPKCREGVFWLFRENFNIDKISYNILKVATAAAQRANDPKEFMRSMGLVRFGYSKNEKLEGFRVMIKLLSGDCTYGELYSREKAFLKSMEQGRSQSVVLNENNLTIYQYLQNSKNHPFLKNTGL